MFKKLLIAFIVAVSLVGCKTKVEYYDPENTVISSPDFNQETYVWESFNFSTNRVNSTTR